MLREETCSLDVGYLEAPTYASPHLVLRYRCMRSHVSLFCTRPSSFPSGQGRYGGRPRLIKHDQHHIHGHRKSCRVVCDKVSSWRSSKINIKNKKVRAEGTMSMSFQTHVEGSGANCGPATAESGNEWKMIPICGEANAKKRARAAGTDSLLPSFVLRQCFTFVDSTSRLRTVLSRSPTPVIREMNGFACPMWFWQAHECTR